MALRNELSKDEFIAALEIARKGILQIIKKQEEVINENSPGNKKL